MCAKTQILSISPLLKTAAKRSILRAALEGPIAEGCVAEEFVFDPKTLTIDGPEEIINKIEPCMGRVRQESDH